jgi:L-threonylcarbamoyladenylate synthase
MQPTVMTDVLHVDPGAPNTADIARAAACLRRGGLVAFPTETVYGLGAHALDPVAVRRLFDAKERPRTDPLIVHVASRSDLPPLVRTIPAAAAKLAERFWPGPLTLVLPRSSAVPDEVTAGLPTVAVRVPAHPVALALLRSAAVPVAAPSANRFSRPSPTAASHVIEDLDGRIDLVLDGGPTRIGVESTVLDLSGHIPAILRPGAITVEMLREVLPNVETPTVTSDEATPMVSPGQLARHYAPRAPLTVYEGGVESTRHGVLDAARTALLQGKIVGIVAADEDREALAPLEKARRGIRLRTIGSRGDLDAVAARLYSALRELDAERVDVILVTGFPASGGLGPAVQDRLRRAATGRIVRC